MVNLLTQLQFHSQTKQLVTGHPFHTKSLIINAIVEICENLFQHGIANVFGPSSFFSEFYKICEAARHILRRLVFKQTVVNKCFVSRSVSLFLSFCSFILQK